MQTFDIPKRFFFRYNIPCKYTSKLWAPRTGTLLDETYRLPSLSQMETAVQSTSGVDFRIAWNEQGLSFSVEIKGKKRGPWCRLTHPEDSEGIQLCIDTRDVRNVHRASRFCHRLAFLPLGNGSDSQSPAVLWFPIHRAKGHPNSVPVERIAVQTELLKTGYRLDATIPADAFTGYDPLEYSLIGFHYFIVDQELGNQAFVVGQPFPHDQDPSLWATLELKR
ncbi:MAG: hypothetical protein ACRC2T_05670 [Thermoguttaceae bacterium]